MNPFADAQEAACAWADFTGLIGATTITEDRFHPFFHEIVDVVTADDWRTGFRRDYRADGELRYNVDEQWSNHTGPPRQDNLTPQEELDLLRYRHGVLRDLGDDCWPYDDHHRETW